MKEDTHVKKVLDLIDKEFQLPEGVNENTPIKDLGFSSMDLYEVIFLIEDEFDVNISIEADLITVKDLVDQTRGKHD